MRISSKGRITIPREIREAVGLLPNTEVEFKLSNGCVELRPAGSFRSSRIDAIEGLRGSLKHLKCTTAELMRLTRGRG